MVAKKKILFFMWSFSLGGGAEKILSTIVSNLDPDQYEIDILEMEHFDKGYEPVPDHVHILKAFQDYRQSRFVRALLWRFRQYFPRLTRKCLLKDHYDIEVSFTIMILRFYYLGPSILAMLIEGTFLHIIPHIVIV